MLTKLENSDFNDIKLMLCETDIQRLELISKHKLKDFSSIQDKS